MTAKIISDLHGGVGALRREIGEADTLILLGDLVNIIDYVHMEGILLDIFSKETVSEAVALRAEGRYLESKAAFARERRGREEEVAAAFAGSLRNAYWEVFDALGSSTMLILGNVDSPAIVSEFVRGDIDLVDGQVREIEGLRVGFVGGGLPTALNTAGEIPEAQYNAKLESLGTCDVICSHMPPDIPELTFDTLAGRHERSSERLREYVFDVQPRSVYFGHVHQPLVSSMHVGKSHLVNCGYFRRTQRALRLVESGEDG